MPTDVLIVSAVLAVVAILGIVWLIQYRQQKAIEKARAAVLCSDGIRELHQLVESTALVLDDSLIQFAGQRITALSKQLSFLGTGSDKKLSNMSIVAQQWANKPASARREGSGLPENPKQAQNCSILLKHLLGHIRNAVKEKKIDVGQAKQLANRTRISNIKLITRFYTQQGKAAVSINKHRLALRHFKKARQILEQHSSLPEDLKKMKETINQDITREQDALKEQTAGNSEKRLETEFNRLEEDDQFQQKKTAL